jgi:glutamate/tyrosine decarboxylase-like PLP-dependent enzyme
LSRRGRSITVYAALRTLGRRGVRELVSRCCALARRMADALRREPGVVVLNDVVLNQVLVRVDGTDGANVTPQVIGEVQRDGVCWLGGTQWAGAPAMRISVSGWSTTDGDIDRSAASIARAIRSARGVLIRD